MSDLIRSLVESANNPDTPFPLNNMAHGVFSVAGAKPRCGIAIGDLILDVAQLEADAVLSFAGALKRESWNAFMALGPSEWARLRNELAALLREDAPEATSLRRYLVPQREATLHMPLRVSEFTDFYAGRNHAENVGTMFRGAENALPTNWLHMPVGYNGRSSSVVVSGTDIVRPIGQIKDRENEAPRIAPSARFDFELELGAIVGQPSDGPIGVQQAFDNIFGYVLLNDWSARDIQAWEYQPLGPFTSKASATTISPWIVPAAALEPFRTKGPPRDPALLPYLTEPAPMLYDITLSVGLIPEGGRECMLSRTNARELYYSSAQQLAHHTVTGCPMRVGDLLGSGTISGAAKTARGSLLELSWGGAEPVRLAAGESRTFLVDGDTVTFRGAAMASDYRIGFGECTGRVLPART